MSLTPIQGWCPVCYQLTLHTATAMENSNHESGNIPFLGTDAAWVCVFNPNPGSLGNNGLGGVQETQHQVLGFQDWLQQMNARLAKSPSLLVRFRWTSECQTSYKYIVSWYLNKPCHLLIAHTNMYFLHSQCSKQALHLRFKAQIYGSPCMGCFVLLSWDCACSSQQRVDTDFELTSSHGFEK